MSGNLLIPIVEVYWGKTNLTSYDGPVGAIKGEPVVFKVEAHLEAQGTGPTASLSWNPSGPGYDAYKDLVDNHINETISITYGYRGKKMINLKFIWGGQDIAYGNAMAIKVHLLSELCGVINADTRSPANVKDTGITLYDAVSKTEKLYGVDSFKLVSYSETALKDMRAAKIQSQYGQDQTFGSEVAKLAQQNGNIVFPNSIGTTNLVIFTPYTWEKGDVVRDGAAIPARQSPDPKVRYGYLVGPSIINTLERRFQWVPPQQTSRTTPSTQKTPVTKGKQKQGEGGRASANEAEVSQKPGAVRGSSSQSRGANLQNLQNPDAAAKQICIQQETAATLSFNTFLTPALVGIKPHDIVYVPSLTGKEIEDWIVNAVDYDQTDGGININVTANRTYGVGGTLMNKESGEKFHTLAKTLRTLSDWQGYAWGQNAAAPVNTSDAVSTTPDNQQLWGDHFTGDYGVQRV